MRGLVMAVCLVLSGPMQVADGWNALTGAEIVTALTARHLVYEGGATQQFNADGSTIYEDGSVSSGRWRVEGDLYCSVWPPSDRWTCYGVARSADGLDLQFVAGDGSVTVGRYDDL